MFEFKWKERIGPIIYLSKDKKYSLCLCHKNKNRTIKFLGFEKFLCSRCLGVLFGIFLGILLHFSRYYFSPMVSLLKTWWVNSRLFSNPPGEKLDEPTK